MISRNSINGAFPIKRLGEVVEFLDSRRRPVTESDRHAGDYPYYGANGQQGTIDGFIFDEPLVLLAEDGGHFGEPERGIAYRISGKTWVNNHAHVLRPTSGIDLAYLCRVLENYDVTPFVTGTTRGKLTKAGASEIVIPLPPIAEQRRIAELLDGAEALRARRRAALAQLDALTQSIFLDLFGDPITNVRDWPVSPIGELKVHIADGNYSSKYPTSNEFIDSGIPFIRANNLRGLTVVEDDLRFISPAKHHELQKGHLVEGDVLITTRGEIGKVAVVPRHFQDANINAQIVLLRPNGTQLDSRYLAHMLNLPQMKIRLQSYQNGVALKQLPIRQLVRVPVPIPPLPLQREFASRARAVEKLKAAQRASLAEMGVLFATLQHGAFNGELFSKRESKSLVA